jgi:hypothetical protein
VDRGDEDLLDRAYERRAELLAQPGIRWVRMHLEKRGVSLVVEETGGGQRAEWLPRTSEPADGGAGNGDYDRE